MQSSTEVYANITHKGGYVSRRNQELMIEAIDQCFSQNDGSRDDGANVVVVEAPTGTGKSLAYILASVVNALRLGKKVLIATATKNLQNQLIEKDIPLFINTSAVGFSYVLAKGRNNYLCPYQLGLSLSGAVDDLLFDGKELRQLLERIDKIYKDGSFDGDLDSLDFDFNAKYKSAVTIDKERCLGNNCPFNQENNCQCPFYRQRARIRSCDVIITNHNLLIADLTLGAGSILGIKPENYLLCLDEAHNFPRNATSNFSGRFELNQVLPQYLSHIIYNQDSYVNSDISFCQNLLELLEELRATLHNLELILTENVSLFVNDRLIINDYLNPGLGSEFRDYFAHILLISAEVVNKVAELILKLKADQGDGAEITVNKLAFYSSQLLLMQKVSENIMNHDDSKHNAYAKWITRRVQQNQISFTINAEMVSASKALKDYLWTQVYAAVVTSATLAIGSDFSFYSDQLGFDSLSAIKYVKLGDTFNYKKQALIVVPKFKFAPDYNNRSGYLQELTDYLIATLNYQDGYGTLVLFFNQSQMQEVYDSLPHLLRQKILNQNEFSSSARLLQKHCQKIDKKEPSVIFGLNSFAQGVDLPGLYCLHVIITKLPFETHKDPGSMVLEYWVEYEKGNYFSDIALPLASIRLIQAVGRLLRSENDHGQVTICDSRLITKPYGLKMLQALPDFNRTYDKEWLNKVFLYLNGQQLSGGCGGTHNYDGVTNGEN